MTSIDCDQARGNAGPDDIEVPAKRPADKRFAPAQQQLTLAGFEVEPRPTDRLFFALYPDEETAARMGRLAYRLRDEHGLQGAPLRPERFQVTLHHLGDHMSVRHDIISRAQAAAATVSAAAFEMTLDRVMSYSGRTPRPGAGNHPIVLRGDAAGLAAAQAFQEQLGWAMKKAALGAWVDARFAPHLTLLYDDRPVAEQPVEPITWTARELVLVHSLIGQTVHVPLGRWPLNG